MSQSAAKQRLQEQLERALGRKLPEVGTHEFNRLLVELGQKDPQILGMVTQAIRSAKETAAPSPEALKEEVVRRVVRGASKQEAPDGAGGGNVGQRDKIDGQGQGATPLETRTGGDLPTEEEEPEAPPPPPSKPPKGKKGVSPAKGGYDSFRKKVESKQRAERGIRRLLQIFEPNLRTYVPHPKKTLTAILIAVSPFALFWVFEKNIRSLFAARGEARPPGAVAPAPELEAPLPPPLPEAQTGSGRPEGTPPGGEGEGQPQKQLPAPPVPSAQAQGGNGGEANGEASPPQGGEGQGGEQAPPPALNGQTPPTPPPPPQLPVYGEELPPPPAQGGSGQQATPEAQTIFKKVSTEGSGPLRKDVVNSEVGSPILKQREVGRPLAGGAGAAFSGGQGGGEGGGPSAPPGNPSGPLVVKKLFSEENLGPTRNGPVETRPQRGTQTKEEEVSLSPQTSPPFASSPTFSPTPQGSASSPLGGSAPSASQGGTVGQGTTGASSQPVLSLPPNWQNLAANPGSLASNSGGFPSGNSSPSSRPSSPPVPAAPTSATLSGGERGGRIPELPLRYGEILKGQVVVGIVMAEGTMESPILISLKGKGGEEIVLFGSASLNPRTNRVSARFDRAYVDNVAYIISGYLVDSRGTLGVYARVSEEAPNVAVNLLRGAFGGLRQYVDYYAKATSTTVVPGTGVVTSSAPPPLGLTVLASALGQLAAPPDQVSIVRVWSVDRGTEVGVVITPPSATP